METRVKHSNLATRLPACLYINISRRKNGEISEERHGCWWLFQYRGVFWG